MKQLSRFLPVISVIAGITGAIFRQQLFTAADEYERLPQDHIAHVVLLVLLGLMGIAAVLTYLFSSGENFRTDSKFPVQAVGCGLAALSVIGLGGIIGWLLCATFALLAFFYALRKKPPLALPAILSLLLLLNSFLRYRSWTSATQLQEFLFPAIAFLSLALYAMQILYLEMPSYRFRTAFAVQQVALFSCIVCLSTEYWLFFLGMSLWILSTLFYTPCRMILPKEAAYCIQALEKAGYQAYAVGGCVRDAMLGNTPHDYDLCTNATPEQICQVFATHKLVTAGEKHGTIGVILHNNTYEITTYRTEGGYQDNRHPDWVEFVGCIDEDLQRRDFTVNAMAFHPKTGYYDPLGGQKDLHNGILRAVGDPNRRFTEDALRILRGVRFACRFGLTVENDTMQAMKELAPQMDSLAKERILSELTQILCYLKELDLLTYQDIFMQVIPELKPCAGFDQHNPHHRFDVLTHTALVLSQTDAVPALRWAALLHDIGKPQVFTRDEKGVGHFHAHAQVSAQIANDILLRLKASNALREQVVFLVEHHMDPLPDKKAALQKKLSKYGAQNLKLMIQLQAADKQSCGKQTEEAYKTAQKLLKLTQQLLAENACLQIKDLAIDGHDLLALGFEAGPALGQCQKQLLEMVLSGTIPNEKEALLQQAKAFLEQ